MWRSATPDSGVSSAGFMPRAVTSSSATAWWRPGGRVESGGHRGRASRYGRSGERQLGLGPSGRGLHVAENGTAVLRARQSVPSPSGVGRSTGNVTQMTGADQSNRSGDGFP